MITLNTSVDIESHCELFQSRKALQLDASEASNMEVHCVKRHHFHDVGNVDDDDSYCDDEHIVSAWICSVHC